MGRRALPEWTVWVDTETTMWSESDGLPEADARERFRDATEAVLRSGGFAVLRKGRTAVEYVIALHPAGRLPMAAALLGYFAAWKPRPRDLVAVIPNRKLPTRTEWNRAHIYPQ